MSLSLSSTVLGNTEGSFIKFPVLSFFFNIILSPSIEMSAPFPISFTNGLGGASLKQGFSFTLVVAESP